MGLDRGGRRIGVAVSDPAGFLASPVGTIEVRGKGEGLAEVAEWVRRYEPVRIVVGLPLLLDGREGEEAQTVRAWVEQLQQLVSVPIELWDERLSSVAAERLLIESRARRGRRQEQLDAAAAALILQSWLDAQRAEARGREQETGSWE